MRSMRACASWNETTRSAAAAVAFAQQQRIERLQLWVGDRAGGLRRLLAASGIRRARPEDVGERLGEL
jgi:hypothetical protein